MSWDSSMPGRGYEFFLVTPFTGLYSGQSHQVLFFLGTMTTADAQLSQGSITPLLACPPQLGHPPPDGPTGDAVGDT